MLPGSWSPASPWRKAKTWIRQYALISSIITYNKSALGRDRGPGSNNCDSLWSSDFIWPETESFSLCQNQSWDEKDSLASIVGFCWSGTTTLAGLVVWAVAYGFGLVAYFAKTPWLWHCSLPKITILFQVVISLRTACAGNATSRRG